MVLLIYILSAYAVTEEKRNMDKKEQSFKERVRCLLEQKDYTPARRVDLAKRLNLKSKDKVRLQQILRELEHDGKAVRIRKNRWAPASAARQITGTLSVHPSGFAFLMSEDEQVEDVFIPARELGSALHGDLVSVQETEGRDGRKAGKIIRMLDRKRGTRVGQLVHGPYYDSAVLIHPRLHRPVQLLQDKETIKSIPAGHLVAVDLELQRTPRDPLRGRVVEDLGPADAPGADLVAVQMDHGLTATFNAEVEQQARSCPPTPSKEQWAGRQDFTKMLTFTIDPEDAKDFDDALSWRRDDHGIRYLGVHIADVASQVEPDSIIDREARARSTSVYLADKVIPMLPEYLTNDICSLRAHVDRLTHSVEFKLDERGRVISYQTFPSVIHSNARLTYGQVQALFDQGDETGIPAEVCTALNELRPLVRKWRNQRRREGALCFSLPEARCLVDDRGVATEVVVRAYYEANQLVEECMLMANKAIAEKLVSAERPGLFRIHEAPDEVMWAQMAAELMTLGVAETPTSSKDLNRIARKIDGQPGAFAIYVAMLRNMKQARYTATCAPHFGLAAEHYLHFTSPIRRYPDLVVHRALKALELGEPTPYTAKQCAELARHCSICEREADEAEQESQAVKRFEWYRARLKAGDIGPWDGVVTSVRKKGVVVELPDTLQRGFIAFADINDDRFELDEFRTRARSRHGGATIWKLGQMVRVILVAVDDAQRQLILRLEKNTSPAHKKHKKKSSGKPAQAKHKNHPKRSSKKNSKHRKKS